MNCGQFYRECECGRSVHTGFKCECGRDPWNVREQAKANIAQYRREIEEAKRTIEKFGKWIKIEEKRAK